MTDNLTLTIKENVQVVVPDSLNLITPYVLMEQEDWFEDEIKFLRKALCKGQKVVDIGANYGVYTLSMAKTVGADGHVYAFEPTSKIVEALSASISKNGFSNVTLDPSALSSHTGVAQLSLNNNSELNALLQTDQMVGESETVPLTTLDECIKKYNWHDISFMKIDAEGEESNILKGGQRFFKEFSPLVQYEVKAGADWHLELVNEFASLGYQSYRLVPGLEILEPFDQTNAPDGFLLNLLCCKPDRAKILHSQGFLVDADAHLSGTEQISNVVGEFDNDWFGKLSTLPYGSELISVWQEMMRTGIDSELKEALSYYFMSKDSNQNIKNRLYALKKSFTLLTSLCQKNADNLRLSSLARVAQEYGERAVAVNALAELMRKISESGQVVFDEPFLSPDMRFDAIVPVGQISNWLVASILETFEKLSAFSSFYTGKTALERLKLIKILGFSSEEMERRLQLLIKRFGIQDGVTPSA